MRKNVKKKLARRRFERVRDYRRRLLRAGAAAGAMLFAFASPAMAGPVGEQVVSGNASFARNGNTTTITASNNAIINYSSFNIAQNEAVRFVQPNAASRVLNRINDPNMTRIDGRLSANGRVYIVNPSGVFFGGNAVVNAAHITAAAGTISDANFLSGIDSFTNMSGAVVSHGRIEGNVVNLLGSRVANYGSIVAPDGMVTMAAGDNIYLAGGDSPLMVRVSGAGSATSTDPGVLSSGSISANRVNMFGAADRFALAAAHTGNITANDVSIHGEGGQVQISGDIDASSATGVGGTIDITAPELVLGGNATLDASGYLGGGQIRIGGDYHGTGDLPTADYTFVGPDVSLKADATGIGDGGRIIVWADHSTWFGGSLSAHGGAQGGDGGFAEVSGAINLAQAGTYDLSAPAGTPGSLLFDPLIVYLVGGTADGDDASAVSGFFSDDRFRLVSQDPLNPFGRIRFDGYTSNDPTPFMIYESELETEFVAFGGNLIVEAGQSIQAMGTFGDSDGDGVADLFIDSNITNPLRPAPSGIGIILRTRNNATDGAGVIDLTTSTHGAELALQTQLGGEITIEASTSAVMSSDVNLGRIISDGGTVTVTAFNGNVTVSGQVDNPTGTVTFKATDDVTATANTTVNNLTYWAGSDGTGQINLGDPLIDEGMEVNVGAVLLRTGDGAGGITTGSLAAGALNGVLFSSVDRNEEPGSFTIRQDADITSEILPSRDNFTSTRLGLLNFMPYNLQSDDGNIVLDAATPDLTSGAILSLLTDAVVREDVTFNVAGFNYFGRIDSEDPNDPKSLNLFLNVVSGFSSVTLSGNIGTINPLRDFSVTVPVLSGAVFEVYFDGPTIITTGTQLYEPTAFMDAPSNLTGGEIRFDEEILGASSLTAVATAGEIYLEESIDTGALDLTASEGVQFWGEEIRTTGTQRYRSTIFLNRAFGSRVAETFDTDYLFFGPTIDFQQGVQEGIFTQAWAAPLATPPFNAISDEDLLIELNDVLDETERNPLLVNGVIKYDFRNEGEGETVNNFITPAEIDRAEEALQIWADAIGIEFVRDTEAPREEILNIGVGELAVVGDVSSRNANAFVSEDGTRNVLSHFREENLPGLVSDNLIGVGLENVVWIDGQKFYDVERGNDSTNLGPFDFFTVVVHEVGRTLGLAPTIQGGGLDLDGEQMPDLDISLGFRGGPNIMDPIYTGGVDGDVFDVLSGNDLYNIQNIYGGTATGPATTDVRIVTDDVTFGGTSTAANIATFAFSSEPTASQIHVTGEVLVARNDIKEALYGEGGTFQNDGSFFTYERFRLTDNIIFEDATLNVGAQIDELRVGSVGGALLRADLISTTTALRGATDVMGQTGVGELDSLDFIINQNIDVFGESLIVTSDDLDLSMDIVDTVGGGSLTLQGRTGTDIGFANLGATFGISEAQLLALDGLGQLNVGRQSGAVDTITIGSGSVVDLTGLSYSLNFRGNTTLSENLISDNTVKIDGGFFASGGSRIIADTVVASGVSAKTLEIEASNFSVDSNLGAVTVMNFNNDLTLLPSTSTGDLTIINNDGDVTDSGEGVIAVIGSLDVTAPAMGASISLTNLAVSDTVTLTADGDATIANQRDFTLGTSTVGGNLTVDISDGEVLFAPGTTVGGQFSLATSSADNQIVLGDEIDASSYGFFVTQPTTDVIFTRTMDTVLGETDAAGNVTILVTGADFDTTGNIVVDGLLSITVNGGTLTNSGNIDVSGDGGGISLVGDMLSLTGGMIDFGANVALVAAATNGTAIDIGSPTDLQPDTLEISQADLSSFVGDPGGTIAIGSSTAGDVVFSQLVSLTDTNLVLITGGSVTDDAGAGLIAQGLGIQAVGDVVLDSGFSQVNAFAASSGTGDVELVSNIGTEIGKIQTFGGLISGIDAPSGNALVTTSNGPITTTAPINAGNFLELRALDSGVTVGGTLTSKASTVLDAFNGDIVLNAAVDSLDRVSAIAIGGDVEINDTVSAMTDVFVGSSGGDVHVNAATTTTTGTLSFGAAFGDVHINAAATSGERLSASVRRGGLFVNGPLTSAGLMQLTGGPEGVLINGPVMTTDSGQIFVTSERNGSITVQDQIAGNNLIILQSTDDIVFSSTGNITSTSQDVILTATNDVLFGSGSIDAFDDVVLTTAVGDVTMDAAGTIDSEEGSVQVVSARHATTGTLSAGVDVQLETVAGSITTLGSTAAGNDVSAIANSGGITVGQTVTAGNNVSLQAPSVLSGMAVTEQGGDIAINADVTATGGAVTVNDPTFLTNPELSSLGTVALASDTTITGGSGTTSVSADLFTMGQGSQIDAGAGMIAVQTDQALVLQTLTTTSASDTAIVINSLSGGVSTADPFMPMALVAPSETLVTPTLVAPAGGLVVNAAGPINVQTQVRQFTASTSANGGITVGEVDDLELVDVLTTGGNGAINVDAGGALGARNVDAGTRNVTLDATSIDGRQTTTTNAMMQIVSAPDVAGNNITLTAGDGGIGATTPLKVRAASTLNATSTGTDVRLLSLGALRVGQIDAGSTGTLRLTVQGPLVGTRDDLTPDLIAQNIILNVSGGIGSANGTALDVFVTGSLSGNAGGSVNIDTLGRTGFGSITSSSGNVNVAGEGETNLRNIVADEAYGADRSASEGVEYSDPDAPAEDGQLTPTQRRGFQSRANTPLAPTPISRIEKVGGLSREEFAKVVGDTWQDFTGSTYNLLSTSNFGPEEFLDYLLKRPSRREPQIQQLNRSITLDGLRNLGRQLELHGLYDAGQRERRLAIIQKFLPVSMSVEEMDYLIRLAVESERDQTDEDQLASSQ